MFGEFHFSEDIIVTVSIDLMSEEPCLYPIPEGKENISGCRVSM
jgi:hypothetical protein